MNTTLRHGACRLVLAAALGMLACGAQAQKADDGMRAGYREALQGARVAFVPMSLSYDAARAWHEGMKRAGEKKGYSVVVRDSNWRVDVAVQAAEQLINEKPDVLVLHADDLMAFNRTIHKATRAGIRVIQLNVKSQSNGDVFIGPDWYEVGRMKARAAAEFCGKAGRSGEVAIIHGQSVSSATRTIVPGIEDELARHQELKVVAKQSGDYDPNTARGVAATILRQHPNLCAFIGLWDAQDIGIAAAVRQAGRTGEVAVITEGAGSVESACNQVKSGNFTYYMSWNTRNQVATLTTAIDWLLQSKQQPGSDFVALYSPIEVLTKDSLSDHSCWSMSDIAGSDG